jgi:hypothetical protein
MVRNLAAAVAIGALAVATAAAFGACSKDDSPEKPTYKTPTTTPVVTAVWGSGEGQLGHDVPEEGLPQGPKTLVVESSGMIRVLDGANHRIQSFNGSSSAGSIKIPDRPFDDLELDGAGGFVLLDRFDTPALVFLNPDGTTRKELPLESEEIPEPSLTTGLVRGPDGFYVEIESDYLVRVSDLQGSAMEQIVVPGQTLDETSAFKVDGDEPNLLTVSRIDLPDGELDELGELDVHDRVAERTLFTLTKNAGLLLAVRLESDQSDPEKPPNETHRLLVLGTDGKVKKSEVLPTAGGPEDVFRPVRLGEDGNVYVMTITETGVDISKVAP